MFFFSEWDGFIVECIVVECWVKESRMRIE